MKKAFFAFKLYYLIYILFAFNAFVNETPLMRYGTLLLTAAGLVMVLLMAARFRTYLKMYHIWLIGAFLASYVLSSLMTYRYGITDNAKEIVWLLLTMVFLYASSYTYTAKEMNQEFCVLSAVWVVYCALANAVSISMIVWGREYGIEIVSETGKLDYKLIGFKWGRLWGIYDDPNHGAVIAVAAIFLALYLMRIMKRKWLKALWILTIPVQFVYLVLSDSRTGLVTLGVGIFCWCVLLGYSKYKNKGYSPRKAAAVSILFGFLLACVCIGAAYGAKQQYNRMDQKIVAFFNRGSGSTSANKKPSAQVGRKKDLVEDTTNGRFRIWASGLEITKTRPIFGTSFRNMTVYAQENLPETYLVNNPEGAKYDSLHNSVLDILVSQGIIGIGILLALIGNTFVLMKKRIRSVRYEDREFMVICFVLFTAMAAASMFLTLVFYLNAPETYIFWLCFGYFMAILQKGEDA